jgi:hypothetical protein
MKNAIHFLVITATVFYSFTSFAQKERRNLLSKDNNIERLSEIVIPYNLYHPYPNINERDEWESIPDSIREKMIKDGAKYLGYEWKTIPASIALDFVRNGNRSRYEDISFHKRAVLTTLLFAELAENKGRFLDDITNGIWSICEESFWGVSAHLSAQTAGAGLPDIAEPIVDLFAAETSSLLSWTYYLLGNKLDGISKLIRPRIKYEIGRRIFQPYLSIESGWMGFINKPNNWNPWINSNLIISVLLIQDNQEERINLIRRALITLDNFINPYPDDGGCDEGPAYWNVAGGRLFTCLDYLFSCTNGRINIYDNPLIKNIAAYIYKMHISGKYFFNTGDGSAIVNFDPMLIYSIGKNINDNTMMSFGSFLYKKSQRDSNDYYFNSPIHLKLATLFTNHEIKDYPAEEALLKDFWFVESQYMGARSQEGSSQGLYLAVQGGHNAESHNHNDVGNFIIYADGQPAIIDAGVETYTAKTFSSKRYEIWTMQSAYHNLPTINGYLEKEGAAYKAADLNYFSNEKSAQLSMDISKAYPAEAKVKRWIRLLKLNRGDNIELNENYELSEFLDTLRLNFMTCLEPQISIDGKIILKPTSGFPNTNLIIHFDKNKFSAHFEKIQIVDNKLFNVWGDSLTRIILTAKNKNLKDEIKISFKQ